MSNKTFKAFKTGRVYDVEQILYCSFEKTGHCDILDEDEFTVVLSDPSRGLSYRYENQFDVDRAEGVLSTYDNARSCNVSIEDAAALEKHFGLKEIEQAIRAIKNARYEMNCIHDASDRKHELSVAISEAESFIDNQTNGKEG